MSSNNPKKQINRCGIKPNPKFFTIPNSKRNFEFMNPNSLNYEIKGNMRHYEPQKQSEEIQKFSSFTKQTLPNSKRTIIPSYQPINEKEKTHHKAISFYSYKFNTNSVGADLLPNEEPKVLSKRKTAGRILQESNPPLNIRQLKPNRLHQKYIESSQIDNIPGPDIMKRPEEKKSNIENDSKLNNDKKYYKYSNKYYQKNNTNNPCNKKSAYAFRKNDVESFQRKVIRDYNSNIACLPGVTLNEKEKTKTLVATNSKKNESHISLGNNENINLNNIKNKYDYSKKSKNTVPRAISFSGKRIIRDRNKESTVHCKIINNRKNKEGYLRNNEISSNEYDNSKINSKPQKIVVDKNKSQIIFG